MHLATPNALVASSSFDRAPGPITSPGQAYNNFQVQAKNAPIVQGAIANYKMAEILFPYDVPTIVYGKNDALILGIIVVETVSANTYENLGGAGIGITIPPGWYCGAELAAEIQTAISAALVTEGLGAGDILVQFDAVSQRMVIANGTVWDPASVATNYLFQIVPSLGVGATSENLIATPQLLTTAGFRNIFLSQPAIQNTIILDTSGNPAVPFLTPILVPTGFPNGAAGLFTLPSGYHPVTWRSTPVSGRYTDWVDLCSPILCQSQDIRDSTTNQVTLRKDIISRIYIADDVSLQPATDPSGNILDIGCRPFTIHRQFLNPKIMKSNNDNSLSGLDLVLYDMYGQPLPLPNGGPVPPAGQSLLECGGRDYGITLMIEESSDVKQGNMGYRF